MNMVPFTGKNRRSERGDVLLEYVLLMVFIIVPVVCGSKLVYNAGGYGTTRTMTSVAMGLEKEEDYGIVGDELVKMFRRTFMGLALPIP